MTRSAPTLAGSAQPAARDTTPLPMSVKRVTRMLLDRIAERTGLLARCERAMIGAATILTYHRVLPDDGCAAYPLASLATPSSLFREQVAALRVRFRVATVTEALANHGPGSASDRPLVAVTFDDGYADNHQVAAPILDEAGIHATFFVVAGLIGADEELWFDTAARRWRGAPAGDLWTAVQAAGVRPAWPPGQKPTIAQWMGLLKSLPVRDRSRLIDAVPDREPARPRDPLDRMMTPDQLRDLRRRGHEIGSHTLTHPLLPGLDDRELAVEIAGSRRRLESWLGEPVRGFCYPNGDLDQRVVEAVRRAGYEYACTTVPGRNLPAADRLRLRRIDMNPRRTVGPGGRFDRTAFRAELSLLHECLR